MLPLIELKHKTFRGLQAGLMYYRIYWWLLKIEKYWCLGTSIQRWVETFDLTNIDFVLLDFIQYFIIRLWLIKVREKSVPFNYSGRLIRVLTSVGIPVVRLGVLHRYNTSSINDSRELNWLRNKVCKYCRYSDERFSLCVWSLYVLLAITIKYVWCVFVCDT